MKKVKITKKINLIPRDVIENKIFLIRGHKVMIDRDIALLYEVPTKRLNEQVKRNIERFPEDFMFRLTLAEYNELVANCDRFASLKHSSSMPYAFTEQGVAMLSSVLKSQKAINVNITIMRVFVKVNQHALLYKILEEKIKELEKKLNNHDGSIGEIFKTLNYLIRGNEKEKIKKSEIGFRAV